MRIMRYVKLKRERVGACTICKQCDQLTYDHIPPVVAGNTDPVMLVSAMTAISGQAQEDRPLISQNGYKIRSICRECNSAIGREYDPVIGKLCADINRYLASPLSLPLEATFETIPARLIRGLLAHLWSINSSVTFSPIPLDRSLQIGTFTTGFIRMQVFPFSETLEPFCLQALAVTV
jgi:hypothetical protein